MKLLVKLIFFALPVWLFVECSNNNPQINISQSNLSSTIGAYKGDSLNLSFTTNESWTASVTSSGSWLTVNTASGASGQRALSLKVNTTNPDTVSRIATVSIAAGGLTKQITVTQAGSDDGKVYMLQKAQGLSSGMGVNLYLMGDGFTGKDMPRGGYYDQVIKNAMNYYLSVEPVKTYKNCFNIYEIKAVSVDSVYTYGKSGNTAFGVKFASQLTSEIDGDENAWWNYASKAMNNDASNFDRGIVIVIVNSPNWAGTCYFYTTNNNTQSSGSVAYVPMTTIQNGQYLENYFPLILIHESVGHGLGKLADEYSYASNGAIQDTTIAEAKSLYNQYGWYANIDFTSNKSTIKWSKFLTDPYYSHYLALKDTIGAYEGGYTYVKNVWRPETISCMYDNRPYFNAPSREAIVKRIKAYSGETYSFDDFYANDKYVPYTDVLGSLNFYSFISGSGGMAPLQHVFMNMAPRIYKPGTPPIIRSFKHSIK